MKSAVEVQGNEIVSEFTSDAETVNDRRIAVWRADPVMAPTEDGVLAIDEHGDRQ